MSLNGTRARRLRKLAQRIIEDRKSGVAMLTPPVIPGGALLGMGFANTFLRYDHRRRVVDPVGRIVERLSNEHYARGFERIGGTGALERAEHHRQLAQAVRLGQ